MVPCAITTVKMAKFEEHNLRNRSELDQRRIINCFINQLFRQTEAAAARSLEAEAARASRRGLTVYPSLQFEQWGARPLLLTQQILCARMHSALGAQDPAR